MNLNLKGKKVTVFGGSSGIGLACAKYFIDQGCEVMIVGRDMDKLVDAAKKAGWTERTDITLKLLALNLVDPSAGITLAKNTVCPDIIINCQGSAKSYPTEKLFGDQWQDGISAKLLSYTNVIDPFIQKMSDRGYGAIVNVIGIGGRIPAADHTVGGAANAALELATKAYAQHFGAKGVRINGINPAMVYTERLLQYLAVLGHRRKLDDAEIMAEMKAKFPNGELIEMDTVVNTIAFLASEASKSINGTVITIDGARF